MNFKQCFKCQEMRSIKFFYKHSAMGDGYLGKCKDCACKDVRDNRKLKSVRYNEWDRNRYRNNISRMLKMKYLSMSRRVSGLTKHSKLVGKELLNRKEFMDWACGRSYPILFRLHKAWVESGYQRKLAPSIDRIDNAKGYVVRNMRWITQSENSRRPR